MMLKSILIVSSLLSVGQADFSEKTVEKLQTLKGKVAVIQETVQLGLLTEEQAVPTVEHYLREAAKVAGKPLSLEELAKLNEAPPLKLTPLQKVLGLLNFANIIIALGSIVFAVTFYIFLGELFPKEFYEVLVYVIGGFFIGLATRIDSDLAPFSALVGTMTLSAAVLLTISMRSWEISGSLLSAVGSIFWGVVAVLFGSALIGVGAVLLLLMAFGFSGGMAPFVYYIGFDDEDALGRATLAAFTVLLIFVGIKTGDAFLPQSLMVFEKGAYYLGSFVGFLGLLIASSRHYGHKRNHGYAIMQMVTLIACMTALFAGSVWQIPELQKIGGTFFALWLLEKITDIPAEEVLGVSAVVCLTSAATVAGGLYIRAHAEFFSRYIMFM